MQNSNISTPPRIINSLNSTNIINIIRISNASIFQIIIIKKKNIGRGFEITYAHHYISAIHHRTMTITMTITITIVAIKIKISITINIISFDSPCIWPPISATLATRREGMFLRRPSWRTCTTEPLPCRTSNRTHKCTCAPE